MPTSRLIFLLLRPAINQYHLHPMMLPLRDSDFIKAIETSGGQVWLVGGSVRDHLLGIKNKDQDLLVTKLPMESLIRILNRFGSLNLVGKSFGVIKFRPKDSEQEIDIALPRRERSTGTGHKDFAVDFDPEISPEDDLLRRDFTLNALALHIQSGRLIDPAHGRNDLEERLLRYVFSQAFEEDPLRLLRAIQFAARFKLRIEEHTWKSMCSQANLIKTVARERIIEEIRKLFLAETPSLGFDLMRDCGLLRILFPDVERMIGVTQPQKNNEDVYTHTMKVLDASRKASEMEKAGNLEIMFAALFHDAGKPATRRVVDENERVSFFNHQHVSTRIVRQWLKYYKATTIGLDTQRVCHLVRHHMFETKPFQNNERAIRRFINKIGPDYIYDLIDLRIADKKGGRFPDKVFGIMKLREKIRDEITKERAFSIKDLKLNGHDIMSLGFKPGPVIGDIQRFLLVQVLENPELNTPEALARLVNENRVKFTGE